MLDSMLSNVTLFQWVVIPVLIFCARIADVTLGTMRFVLISRGLKYLAAITGFFEVLIWILVIGQIIQNLSNPACYIAYAGGFSTGTFIGIYISEKISMGLVMIRIFTKQNPFKLIRALKRNNHGVTSIEAQGTRGPVKLIFCVVQKKNADKVLRILDKYNPRAFYTIEEIDLSKHGVFSQTQKNNLFRLNRPFRKGK